MSSLLVKCLVKEKLFQEVNKNNEKIGISVRRIAALNIDEK